LLAIAGNLAKKKTQPLLLLPLLVRARRHARILRMTPVNHTIFFVPESRLAPQALKGHLEEILRARKLSQATMRNIRQNLFFAFIYNSIGVPIAAGVLYPVFGLLLSPILAAAAMSLSSAFVITNSLGLQKIRL
jgi:hypothetical protein